jgi:hypothetical protein
MVNFHHFPLQKTSFANHRPYPAFQVSETPIFNPDLCKGSLVAVRFIRQATKPAPTSIPHRIHG